MIPPLLIRLWANIAPCIWRFGATSQLFLTTPLSRLLGRVPACKSEIHPSSILMVRCGGSSITYSRFHLVVIRRLLDSQDGLVREKLVRVAADIARYEDGDDSPWGQPLGKDHKRACSTPSIWCRHHPVAVHLSCAFSFRTSDPLESSFVRERSAPPSLTVKRPL